MINNDKINPSDEIDLKDLFSIFWQGKIYILFFSIFSIFLASMYLQSAERKYTVEYKLKPVGVEKQKNNAFTGLGGIASIAGIQLPHSSSSDFMIYKELITSREVSEIVIKDKEFLKEIYASEWNASLNRFSEIPKSKVRTYVGVLKKNLTGASNVDYIPPNARRLSNYVSKNILIEENAESGFLTIKTETSKPDMMLSLIIAVTDASDKIMRQRYISFAKEPLAFYKQKLRTSRSQEHREVLAELIGKEEQKLMFASRGNYFTAEPYINPKISFHPSSPKPKLVLLVSLIFGLFTGCGVALLRSTIMRIKK
jgi:uncharacterized protein involved in exopolysaccharide biosynthesis